MRIEDLDGPRIKPGAAEQSLDILSWLGLDWDEGPYYQVGDLTPYEAALEQLAAQGDIYPCTCTRQQIGAAAALSAPHGDSHELRYPGSCRPSEPRAMTPPEVAGLDAALRLRVDAGTNSFVDQFAGAQKFDVQQAVGDFLVRTKTRLPSYQLAVVVDDVRQGVDRVVRGDDLLSSTPRQMLLYDKLDLGPYPSYFHLPLVVGVDGRRLAKRHGDSRISYYRECGVAAERIIGLLAEWCGLGPREEASAKYFLERFQLELLTREKVVFTPADDAWLLK